MKRIGELTPGWLERFRRRIDAGELGLSPEDAARRDRERAAAELRQRRLRWSIQESFLSPRHVADAQRVLTGELQPVSEASRKLRRVLSSTPDSSVALVGDTGCGKTTAATAYALKRIRDGWTVRHRAASRFAEVVRSEELLEEYESVDLLILDELHRVAGLPEWISTSLFGLIDFRYERRRQMIGIATAPAENIQGVLGQEVVERFDSVVGVTEKSYRNQSATQKPSRR